MVTNKQRKADKKNIRKAQQKWKSMTSRQHALSQPQGRSRVKPGTKGQGRYYRIVVRPKEQFVTFRVQDVGRKGHSQRLAGKRPNGSWDTQAWLINKKDAHVVKGKLIANDPNTKKILNKLSTTPVHIKGDIFRAKDRKDIPEREKPTSAQRRAQKKNIKKAQKVRWISK